MAANFRRSAAPLITTIQKLFSEDLAKENDFLRQENKILRSKVGKRVPLTEADRRTLVRYGLSIKERLAEVMIIVRPETLLAWNRRMKRQKWTFDNTPKRPSRPSKGKVTEELALRMAEENAWGYVRIAGELKKLGHRISPVLCPRSAEGARAASVPPTEGALVEAVHSGASGCHVGRRFLHGGSVDLSRLGHPLRVVLHLPADPPCAFRRLYSSAGCPLDAAAGSEFLIGDRREHRAAIAPDPRPRRRLPPTGRGPAFYRNQGHPDAAAVTDVQCVCRAVRPRDSGDLG
jgi:hypothetical protein